jgi:hypothetical protein
MTDQALENAKARFNALGELIASHSRQIAEWRSEQDRIGKFIEDWHEFAGLGGDTGLRKGPEIAPAGQLVETARAPENIENRRAKRTTGNPKKEEVVEAARTIIAANGWPMARSDLFKALHDQGIILHGADPEMVLSTMLWRMRHRVVRLPGGGYWLADEPSPDGKYAPGQNTDTSTVNEMPPQEFDHAMGGALDEEE